MGFGGLAVVDYSSVARCAWRTVYLDWAFSDKVARISSLIALKSDAIARASVLRGIARRSTRASICHFRRIYRGLATVMGSYNTCRALGPIRRRDLNPGGADE